MRVGASAPPLNPHHVSFSMGLRMGVHGSSVAVSSKYEVGCLAVKFLVIEFGFLFPAKIN